MIIPQKEQSDQKAIDSAFKENSKAAAKNVKIHLHYAGRYYHNYIHDGDKLRSFILNGMKKHNIKSVMVTSIYLWRKHLITKERMDRISMIGFQFL